LNYLQLKKNQAAIVFESNDEKLAIDLVMPPQENSDQGNLAVFMCEALGLRLLEEEEFHNEMINWVLARQVKGDLAEKPGD